MSKETTTGASRSDWERVDQMGDEAIDTSDIPPLGESFFREARLRLPTRQVDRRPDNSETA
jgi:hypothetical protein